MTAEDLKAALRQYADEHYPGAYRSACAVIDLGPEIEPETLVVIASASDVPRIQHSPEPFALG